MTMTRRTVLRVTVAPVMVLAVLFGIPGHRAVAGISSTRAGSRSSLGVVGSSRHRMSNGKIAFVDGSANASLDGINSDGSGLRRLARCTTRACFMTDPVWSPDGRRIAFLRGMTTRDSYSNVSVYVENANGSGERRLAPCGRPVGCPGLALAWSPDGTGQRRVYHAGHGSLFDATWSPDGQLIAFSVQIIRGVCCKADAARSGLFVMGRDGRHLHRLAAGGGELAWQPIP